MGPILAEKSTAVADERTERIRDHLPLVRAIARGFAHRGEELDDLVQVGTVALIGAADRFRPERGTDFAAFAVPTIVGEIRRHLRDRTAAVRLPRRLYELRGRLAVAQRELGADLGRAPTTRELAQELGAPDDDVGRLLAESSPAPALTSEELADEDAYAGADDRVVVIEALRSLDERRRTIVHLRFFGGLSQAEIGARLGLSQIHVSRLLRSSLDELRARFDGAA